MARGAAMEAAETVEVETEAETVEAGTEAAAREAEKEVATAVVATVAEEPVVAMVGEAMGAGVTVAEMAVEGKAVVMVATQWTHQRNSAPHAAHTLLRTDRFCGCCHEPQYAD